MHARPKLSLIIPQAYAWLSIYRIPYTHAENSINWAAKVITILDSIIYML